LIFISRSRFTTQRIYIGVTVVGKKKEKEKQNENESIAHSIVYKTRTGLCGLLELGKERKMMILMLNDKRWIL